MISFKIIHFTFIKVLIRYFLFVLVSTTLGNLKINSNNKKFKIIKVKYIF